MVNPHLRRTVEHRLPILADALSWVARERAKLQALEAELAQAQAKRRPCGPSNGRHGQPYPPPSPRPSDGPERGPEAQRTLGG